MCLINKYFVSFKPFRFSLQRPFLSVGADGPAAAEPGAGDQVGGGNQGPPPHRAPAHHPRHRQLVRAGEGRAEGVDGELPGDTGPVQGVIRTNGVRPDTRGHQYTKV